MTVNEYLKIIDEVNENGKYKPTVESLEAYPYPQWFEDAKFGIFMHWGVYSVPAFFNEWYERLMYYKGNPTHWHHLVKYGKSFNYKDFIPMFKAEKFDADKWLSFFEECNVRFIMPVGEHHDGFKMYGSELCRWNAAQMGPKRDLLGELKAASERRGIEFCTSSHRAEHYWFPNGGKTVGYDNDTFKEEYRDFYGPCFNPYKRNNLITNLKQEKEGMIPSEEWLDDWLASSCELIDKYKPSALFFDWWVSSCEAFVPYTLRFAAYYCNRSREWGKNICIFYKSDKLKSNCFVLDRERTQLEEIYPKVWQCETASAHNAWSYCTTNIFKKSNEIAGTFADCISKRGTFCLNLGPKADGTICDREIEIMRDLGEWTTKNKEAIWGIHPYKVFGEGRQYTGGLYREKYNFKSTDIRITARDNAIYVFALAQAKDNTYRIKVLGKNAGHLTEKIKWVSVLGYKVDCAYCHKGEYLALKTEKHIDTKMPICFKIELEK
ncbi:MAG: alpha-L-fucosidase [Clostridiales bacterium]|nr:alpha-L-fucosidase [Clostridiales bacterium]